MAFINEYISEEDKQRLGYDYRWVIDRERGMFLTFKNFGGEDRLIRFELHSYQDAKILIRVDAKNLSSGNPKDGLLKWYDLFNFFILDEEMLKKKEESKAILFEAITEYGSGRPNERFENCTVKIT